MRTIQFTDSELLDIVTFYRLELSKATRRIEEIETILTQLGAPQVSNSIASSIAIKNNDRKASAAPAASKITSLPRPKRNQNRNTVLTKKETKSIIAELHNSLVTDSNDEVIVKENKSSVAVNQLKLNGKWIKFIVGLLERHNRVIAAEDIVSEAIYSFDVPDEKQQATKQVIYNTLYKLDLSKRLIGSCTVPGRKGKRYGLRKWFTAEGEIKESFLVKAT
jgi:hypothetical protein